LMRTGGPDRSVHDGQFLVDCVRPLIPALAGLAAAAKRS
jgi:hypothetical protein